MPGQDCKFKKIRIYTHKPKLYYEIEDCESKLGDGGISYGIAGPDDKRAWRTVVDLPQKLPDKIDALKSKMIKENKAMIRKLEADIKRWESLKIEI
jgi:hypothetical protein